MKLGDRLRLNYPVFQGVLHRIACRDEKLVA
jgi:hypothetical protein